MRGLQQQEMELQYTILPPSVYDEFGTEFFKLIRHKCEYASKLRSELNKENESSDVSDSERPTETESRDGNEDIVARSTVEMTKRTTKSIKNKKKSKIKPKLTKEIAIVSTTNQNQDECSVADECEPSLKKRKSARLKKSTQDITGSKCIDSSIDEDDPVMSSITSSDSEGDKCEYKCAECNSIFKRKRSLFEHEKTHVNNTYKCDECAATFRTKKYLRNHRKSHNTEKPYQCGRCGRNFKMRKLLIQHEKNHTDERPYSCSQCDKKFRRKSNLKKHMDIHTGEKLYLCSVCGKKSRTLSIHKIHLKIHENPHELKCDFCGSEFKSEKSLKDHQFHSHGGGNYECEICGLKCRDLSAIKTHKRIHTGERPFKCKLCDYSCNLRTQLTQHERIHTGEKPYQCDTCGKSFRAKGQLTVHQNTHLDVRPYKCDLCGASFRQLGHLQFHKKHKHTTKLIHSCDECGASFQLKKELINHKIAHSTENPIKCDICGIFFQSEILLMKHVKSHLEHPKPFDISNTRDLRSAKPYSRHSQKGNVSDKPFKCHLCPSSFATKANLRRHELRHVQDTLKSTESSSQINFQTPINVNPDNNYQFRTEQGSTANYNANQTVPDFQNSFMNSFQSFINLDN